MSIEPFEFGCYCLFSMYFLFGRVPRGSASVFAFDRREFSDFDDVLNAYYGYPYVPVPWWLPYFYYCPSSFVRTNSFGNAPPPRAPAQPSLPFCMQKIYRYDPYERQLFECTIPLECSPFYYPNTIYSEDKYTLNPSYNPNSVNAANQITSSTTTPRTNAYSFVGNSHQTNDKFLPENPYYTSRLFNQPGEISANNVFRNPDYSYGLSLGPPWTYEQKSLNLQNPQETSPSYDADGTMLKLNRGNPTKLVWLYDRYDAPRSTQGITAYQPSSLENLGFQGPRLLGNQPISSVSGCSGRNSFECLTNSLDSQSNDYKSQNTFWRDYMNGLHPMGALSSPNAVSAPWGNLANYLVNAPFHRRLMGWDTFESQAPTPEALSSHDTKPPDLKNPYLLGKRTPIGMFATAHLQKIPPVLSGGLASSENLIKGNSNPISTYGSNLKVEDTSSYNAFRPNYMFGSTNQGEYAAVSDFWKQSVFGKPANTVDYQNNAYKLYDALNGEFQLSNEDFNVQNANVYSKFWEAFQPDGRKPTTYPVEYDSYSTNNGFEQACYCIQPLFWDLSGNGDAQWTNYMNRRVTDETNAPSVRHQILNEIRSNREGILGNGYGTHNIFNQNYMYGLKNQETEPSVAETVSEFWQNLHAGRPQSASRLQDTNNFINTFGQNGMFASYTNQDKLSKTTDASSTSVENEKNVLAVLSSRQKDSYDMFNANGQYEILGRIYHKGHSATGSLGMSEQNPNEESPNQLSQLDNGFGLYNTFNQNEMHGVINHETSLPFSDSEWWKDIYTGRTNSLSQLENTDKTKQNGVFGQINQNTLSRITDAITTPTGSTNVELTGHSKELNYANDLYNTYGVYDGSNRKDVNGIINRDVSSPMKNTNDFYNTGERNGLFGQIYQDTLTRPIGAFSTTVEHTNNERAEHSSQMKGGYDSLNINEHGGIFGQTNQGKSSLRSSEQNQTDVSSNQMSQLGDMYGLGSSKVESLASGIVSKLWPDLHAGLINSASQIEATNNFNSANGHSVMFDHIDQDTFSRTSDAFSTSAGTINNESTDLFKQMNVAYDLYNNYGQGEMSDRVFQKGSSSASDSFRTSERNPTEENSYQISQVENGFGEYSTFNQNEMLGFINHEVNPSVSDTMSKVWQDIYTGRTNSVSQMEYSDDFHDIMTESGTFGHISQNVPSRTTDASSISYENINDERTDYYNQYNQLNDANNLYSNYGHGGISDTESTFWRNRYAGHINTAKNMGNTDDNIYNTIEQNGIFGPINQDTLINSVETSSTSTKNTNNVHTDSFSPMKNGITSLERDSLTSDIQSEFWRNLYAGHINSASQMGNTNNEYNIIEQNGMAEHINQDTLSRSNAFSTSTENANNERINDSNQTNGAYALYSTYGQGGMSGRGIQQGSSSSFFTQNSPEKISNRMVQNGYGSYNIFEQNDMNGITNQNTDILSTFWRNLYAERTNSATQLDSSYDFNNNQQNAIVLKTADASNTSTEKIKHERAYLSNKRDGGYDSIANYGQNGLLSTSARDSNSAGERSSWVSQQGEGFGSLNIFTENDIYGRTGLERDSSISDKESKPMQNLHAGSTSSSNQLEGNINDSYNTNEQNVMLKSTIQEMILSSSDASSGADQSSTVDHGYDFTTSRTTFLSYDASERNDLSEMNQEASSLVSDVFAASTDSLNVELTNSLGPLEEDSGMYSTNGQIDTSESYEQETSFSASDLSILSTSRNSSPKNDNSVDENAPIYLRDARSSYDAIGTATIEILIQEDLITVFEEVITFWQKIYPGSINLPEPLDKAKGLIDIYGQDYIFSQLSDIFHHLSTEQVIIFWENVYAEPIHTSDLEVASGLNGSTALENSTSNLQLEFGVSKEITKWEHLFPDIPPNVWRIGHHFSSAVYKLICNDCDQEIEEMTLGWVALLLLAAAAGSKSSCDVEAPTRALLCHIGSSLHASFNPCLCSHVIFPNQDFQEDVGRLKARNPKLKVLFKQSETTAAPLPAGADGVYISLDKQPAKDAFPSELKELASKLDDLSSAKRAKAKYEGLNDESGSDELEIILELPAEPKRLAKHYDIKSLAKYVSYFVVPSDNLTDSSQDGLAYHPSRLMGIDDILNADSLVDLLSSMGADHDKLIISLPAYGLQFTLKDDKNNMPGSPVSDVPAKISQTELCKLIGEGGWTLEREEDMTAPYAYKEKKWVSFDDATSASIKGKYVLLRNLGGLSVSSSEDDDWAHSCAGRPLVDVLHHTLTNLARKSRAAQLLSLQDQIHNSLLSPYSGDVQLSPFRIVRVVDRAGSVHVVRKEAKTEFQCSRQGYFTHPSGCNRFYRCVKFNQYSSDFTVFEYDCPAGLAFDERYEVCVWPGSLPDASACKGSSEIAPVPRSRFACSQEGYYADPENCRWFFACLDHQRDGHTPPTAYEFRCPFGLVFDNEKLACDWPWKVAGCGSGQAAYATVTTGTIYPGDILEGRLRPSYAQISDAQVSGGRIPNVEGGLVLGTSLLSGISSQGSGAYTPGSSTHYGNGYGSGNLGAAAYGSGGSDGGYVDNSGAYVHDPSGDSGGEYVHQDGPQVPYIHQDGPQVPYVHQSDSGSYKHQGDGGAYVHQGDGGSYRGDGAYVHQGDSGAYRGDGSYVQQGDGGAYKGDGSGAYVHQGDSGAYRGDGSYVQQGDGGAYKGDGSGAYVHQGDGGAYRGDGSYVQQGDGGAYKGDGSSAYVHQGDSGAYRGGGSYVQQGDGGAYKGDGSSAYVHQGDSGAYRGEGSYTQQGDGGAYKGSGGGAYVHQGDGGAYRGDGASGSGGSYSGQIDSGANNGYRGQVVFTQSGGAQLATGGEYLAGGLVKSEISSSGGSSSGAYGHDSRGDFGGAYSHDGSGDRGTGYTQLSGSSGISAVSGGAYVANNAGSYVKTGTLAGGLTTGPVGISSGTYTLGSSHANDVKTAGIDSGAYLGGVGYVSGSKTLSSYSSGASGDQSGAYVHDTRGDRGGEYIHQDAGYIHQEGAQVPYIHQSDSGAYIHQSDNGAYVHQGDRGAYVHQGDSGAYRYDGAYKYQGDNGAYVHDYRGDGAGYYGGKYTVGQGAYNVKTNLYQGSGNAYGSGAYVHDTRGDYGGAYNQAGYRVSVPVKTYGLDVYHQTSPVIHGYDASRQNVQSVGYIQPAVRVQPITVTGAPAVPLKSVQYIQPAVRPIVATTPVPSVIGYQYRKPVAVVQPISVSPTPAIPLSPVQYIQPVQKVQPVVHHTIQPVLVSTPAPPVVSYGYKTPAISTLSVPKATVQPITVSSTPVFPLNPVQYVTSTPAPSVHVDTQRLQPVQGYSYTKPAVRLETPVVSYQQPIQNVYLSTPAPPTQRVQPLSQVVYSTPAPTYVSSTVRPITVSSTPVVPFNPVQYNVPCTNCAVSQTARPLTVTAVPVGNVQSGYSHTYTLQQQPICTSCATAQTARPITVTSAPVIPLNPIQYSTPAPAAVGYSYSKPAVKFETPVVQQTYTYKQPVVQQTYTYKQPVDQQIYTYKQPVVQQTYTYKQPVVQQTYTYKQPVVQQTYTYKQPIVQPIAVSTPAPPVVSYSYQKPVYSTPSPVFVSSTASPITVSSAPVVPLNPVQYVKQVQPVQVSTVAPAVVGYSYPKPAVKFETPVVRPTYTFKQPTYTYKQPVVQTVVQPIAVTTASPPVTQYTYKQQPIVQQTYTYKQPVVQQTYTYKQPVQPVVQQSYTYKQPVVQQTYTYKQPVVQPIAVSTPAPPLVSYSYQKPIQPVVYSSPAPTYVSSTVRPITVSSTPAVPLNPVQYVQAVSTPAPAVVSYSYPKPAVKFETPVVQQTYTYKQPAVQQTYTYKQPVVQQTYSYRQPVVQQTYTYKQPVAVSTPAPPVVRYTYQQPAQPIVYSTPAPAIVSTTARPITVSSAPVVPLNPVQYVRPVQPTYVSTPSPPIVSYTYQKPEYKTQPIQSYNTVQYQQPIYEVTTPAPPVVVSSTPRIPLNPVQYKVPVQPAVVSYQQTVPTHAPSVVSYQPVRAQPQYVQSKPIVEYNYVQQTPVSYSYPKPAVRLETPVVVSTPAPKYEQQYIKQVVSSPAPAFVSYSYSPAKLPAVAPITVSSTPAVPYSPVQYVRPASPRPQVSYNYVSQPTPAPAVVNFEPLKVVTTPAPPVVNYSYKPVSPVVVSTPTPAVNYYQPAIKTQTVRPYISVTSSSPPVQYVAPVKTVQPVISYNYVKPQPFAIRTESQGSLEYSIRQQPIRPAITVSSTPAVPLAPVQYVSTAQPKPIYSYSYVKPTVETAAPVVTETYRVTTPRPVITVTPTPAVPLAPVQYVQPAPVKPIYNYNYVRPTTTYVETRAPVVQTYKVTTPRPVFVQTSTEQPFVEYKPVRVRPAIQKVYVPAEPAVPVRTTQQPIEYTIKQRPVTTTQQPLGVSYYEEYFDSKKSGGYEYRQPVVQLKEERVPVSSTVDYGYQGEVYSSSFAPIIVPEISTAVPARRRPVQTYVNTVEEESYYSSTPGSIDVHDENLNVHLDIPRVGVHLVSSTTPEQVVEVTSVAPAVKRVRVGGSSNVAGGYYVRKQKVRVRPVVTTTENYPAFFTTTVKPVYSSTVDLTSPTLYSTTFRPTYSTTYRPTSTTDDAELEIEGEDDSKLIQEVSGGFGSVLTSGDSGIIRQGSVSSTTISSLKDGEAIVGVVKKEREQFTGRRRTKVVVVSRLSDFNPLLVGKLGAECSCKSDTQTLDLSKTRTRGGGLFRPATTTVVEPSRDYLPTSTTPLPDELTNFDYDDARPPSQIVEIKPVRKTQRVYTTTGTPLEVSTIEYVSSTRPARKIASASASGSKSTSGARSNRLDPDVDCQRPGLFRHPHLCNKFYSCNWDEWKKRYTVSVFNCPIHLAFDSKLGACNWPSKGPACAENNLLV